MNILGFEVTAIHNGTVKKFPHSDDNLPHDRFIVKVKSPEGTVSFVFYGSYDDYMKHKIKLDEQGLVNAFYAFLSDAAIGFGIYAEFVSDFGYDPEAKNTKAIWRECAKTAGKARILGISSGVIDELINQLQDEYGV